MDWSFPEKPCLICRGCWSITFSELRRQTGLSDRKTEQLKGFYCLFLWALGYEM